MKLDLKVRPKLDLKVRSNSIRPNEFVQRRTLLPQQPFFVRTASQVDFAFILVVFVVNVAIRTIDERTLAATFNFFEFHFDLKYSKKLLKFEYVHFRTGNSI